MVPVSCSYDRNRFTDCTDEWRSLACHLVCQEGGGRGFQRSVKTESWRKDPKSKCNDLYVELCRNTKILVIQGAMTCSEPSPA
jgi:hypothetical protein